MSVKQVFSAYQCKSLGHIQGLQHPGNISESASLAAVQLPPNDYKLCLSNDLITSGRLSSLQVEGIVYACTKHLEFLPSGQRAGFFIGDGAGVGKGRQIAGIVLEMFCRGIAKHVWISTSIDLYFDAVRDLEDLGADIPVIKNIQQLRSTLNTPKEGVLFCTYSTLASRANNGSRMKDLVEWVGGDSWDGVLVFDEAHKAKHGSSKEGQSGTYVADAVLHLQNMLPKARVVYCSATGVSDVSNMAYLSRLGLYGEGSPFKTFADMLSSLGRKGISFMELLSMELKGNGFYVARSLSYQGSEFADLQINLSDRQIDMYNKAVDVWRLVEQCCKEAHNMTLFDKSWVKAYWGAQQRFFKLLCVSMKVDGVVQAAQKDLDDGKCVVIGLQSTGESASDSLDLKPGMTYDMVSVAREILINFVENNFPVKMIDPDSGLVKDNEACVKYRDDLIRTILEMELPGNFLDLLIDGLGGPQHVAEMTGRRGRLVRDKADGWIFEPRVQTLSDMDSVNVEEKKMFMNGTKLVAIISDAASTGISLHADKRAKNRRQRVHFTIELPWSADKAIQQLGRSHRSNQEIPPLYKLVFTDLGGERRFAAAVAKRLQSLGALTRGDRRAASGLNLESLHYDSTLGRKSLKILYDHIVSEASFLPHGVAISDIASDQNFASAKDMHAALKTYLLSMGLELSGNKKAGARDTKDFGEVRKFFNRILGAPVQHQNILFKCEVE